MIGKIRRTTGNRPSLSRVFAFLALIVFFSAGTAQAQTIADTPCDTQYYQTLSARAWLEAQREITQNQNLILKPDSVFEYTCFDLFMRELADHSRNMLSGSGSYGGPLGRTAMVNALNNLVVNSLSSYINLNFEQAAAGTYDLLGGHEAATGIDHDPSAIPDAAASYSCDVMSRVWMAAKCINFVSNPTRDGFYTFEEYTTGLDRRQIPSACTPVIATYATNLATALTSAPWTDDPVQTYLQDTMPQASCTGNCLCDGDPIPTGVRVIRTGGTPNEYDEHVCLQPGCHYFPGPTPTAGCYGGI